MKLGWHVATDQQHFGYGYVGVKLREYVGKAGAHILGHDEFGWDAMVAVTPPRATLIGPYTLRPDLIFHSMFEALPLPPRWPDMLNRVGLVWVPSPWVFDLFRQSGVTTSMMVAGYGYDAELFTSVNRLGRDGPLKVRIWGDNFQSRKNLLAAVQTYVWADLKDATCEIKINDSQFTVPITASEDGLTRDDITIITTPFRRHELVEWLQEGDVLIYLSGGEGFGLQPFEAMATGLPVIVNRNTGMMDYMHAGNVLDVPSKGRRPAPSIIANFKLPEATIEWPDIDAAVEQLRWVAANRDEAQKIGMKGYHSVRHRTWSNAGKIAFEALSQYLQYPDAAFMPDLVYQT